MTPTGKTLWPVLLALLLLAGRAHAALDASVDRQEVALGDTLRLTIAATGKDQLSDIDLSPLDRDFDILQRSTRSSVNIINGRRTASRELVVDLTPRREGTLTIPPLPAGSAATPALEISVDPAPTLPGGDKQVLFDATVDRDSVYVQGQIVLTLRVQQAINLDARSISELKLDHAFVKPLEQKSFQRTVGGRPWLVHEIRYAIFPEQSGSLEIPAQAFSARESIARRSLFDSSNGRLVRRTTDPITIDVLPRPANYPAGATWLPAADLKIEERWSTPPGQLQTGQSATRTVRISGTGLQGAQLPPVMFPSTAGLKYYPDQPEISEEEANSGLVGQRIDSAALVPTEAGTYHIPEIRIPWWDTEVGKLREAVLPGREITVAAPKGSVTAPPAGAAPSLPAAPAAVGNPATPTELWWWRGIALFSAVGWVATLAWLLYQRRGGNRPAPAGGAPEHPGETRGEARAYKSLQAACAADQPAAARRALIDWASALFPAAGDSPLETLAQSDPRLAQQVQALNNHLYAGGDAPWDGRELASLAKSLRKPLQQGNVSAEDTLGLYPNPSYPAGP